MTSLQCIDGTALPAELHVYTPSAMELILPNDTVAYVVAKCHFPAHELAVLDTLYLAKVPGDVNDDRYKDCVPDIPIAFVFSIGQVAGEVPMGCQSHQTRLLTWPALYRTVAHPPPRACYGSPATRPR